MVEVSDFLKWLMEKVHLEKTQQRSYSGWGKLKS